MQGRFSWTIHLAWYDAVRRLDWMQGLSLRHATRAAAKGPHLGISRDLRLFHRRSWAILGTYLAHRLAQIPKLHLLMRFDLQLRRGACHHHGSQSFAGTPSHDCSIPQNRRVKFATAADSSVPPPIFQVGSWNMTSLLVSTLEMNNRTKTT